MIWRLLLFTLALSTPSFAYLDPVTGNIIIQFALAAVAGVALTFGRLKNRAKEFWDGLKKPSESEDSQPTATEDEDDVSEDSTREDAGLAP